MNARASLGRRSARAGAWVGGSHVISQVLRLLGNLALTRLLMPEAFGLMALIFTVILALGLLSDIGSGTVIVQSERGTEEEFLCTAWTLQIIRGVAIWLVGLLITLGIYVGQSLGWFVEGTVYDDARLPALLAVATFGMVIHGFVSMNGRLAERNLELGRLALIDLGVQVLSLLAMVAAAYLTRSVWALVAGGLLTGLLQCLFTHTLLTGPKHRFRLESTAVKELIGKGKWVLLSSLLGFAAVNGDRLLLGGLIDSTTMGLYSIAFALAGIAPGALGAVLAKVIFPAFSEIVRDRPADLPRTYRKFQQITDLCVGLLAGFTFLASDAIIGTLYDPRYHAASQIFAWLAIGSVGVRFLVVEQIYVAMGKPSLLVVAIFPRVVVLFVGLPLGYHQAGMQGALVAVVLSLFAHWPLAMWFRWKRGLNDLRNDIVLPAAIGVGLGLGWLTHQAYTLIAR